MSTKDIEKKSQMLSNRMFDFPETFDWINDLVPRMGFKNSDWKSIKIEEYTKNGKLVVKAEMPGVDPDKDIDVSVEDGYLAIRGERHEEMKDESHSEFSYGSFFRAIPLPKGCDEKSVHAKYKDGILEVSLDLPKEIPNGKKVPVFKG